MQVLDLVLFTPQTTGEIKWEESHNWLASFINLGGVTLEAQDSLAGILHNIAVKKCFAVLLHENQVVSCGLGVLENDYIGLFEIITAKNKRRKGFAKELILHILDWGKHNGAKQAYLQVEINNEPALNLYSKLCFKEAYQYFYRIRDCL